MVNEVVDVVGAEGTDFPFQVSVSKAHKYDRSEGDEISITNKQYPMGLRSFVLHA